MVINNIWLVVEKVELFDIVFSRFLFSFYRYTDPEPESEVIVKKMNYECSGDEQRRSPAEPYRRDGDRSDDASYRREEDRYRSPGDRGSDLETGYKNYEDR